MAAPTEVVADIDHDHGPSSKWVQAGDACPFCGERIRAKRDQYRRRINAYSRAIRRAQIEVGISMEPGEVGKREAQQFLRALRDNRREAQRGLAVFDRSVFERNATTRRRLR